MSVYDNAYNIVTNVDKIVEDRISAAGATTKILQKDVTDTLEALKNVNLNFNIGGPPAPPSIDPKIDVKLDLPPIHATSFGTISSSLPTKPTLDNVPDIQGLDIPEFHSSIGALTIPTVPAWTAPSNAPTRPDIGDVTIPVPPGFTVPPVPQLTEIAIGVFQGLNLPTFNATIPEFSATAIPGILQWTEPTYRTEILDEVMAKIRTLWSGGSGIPPAVEQAMFERASSREEAAANREIDAVSDEFSSRGFTMPSGMQAARTDQIRQDLAQKKLSLNRELTIKIAEWQIENIRFGVQQAIAAENVLVNIFLNAAERMFQAAKYQVDSQIQIYNVQVTLFNARMGAYQAQAQVFESLLKAELSKVEVYKAEIEAEVARGQLNQQRMQIYSATVQALQSTIEIYKAQMQGASVQADVIKNRIEAYRADVSAYAERINADKVRFDAYESQVKAEVAKAGIIDSEAKAYAALVQGKSSIAEIGVKKAELIIQKNQGLISAYLGDLDAEKTRIQTQSSVIQAGAQAYIADTQRFSAIAQAEGTKAQVQVAAKEAELRTNVSFYEAQINAYVANMEQLMRRAALVLDALKSAGQISSTLAAGAMAGVHVGATLSGGGSVAASGSFDESVSTSKSTSVSTSTNYNYEGV